MQILLGRKPNIGSKNGLSTPFVEHSPQLVLTLDQGAAGKEGRQTKPARVVRRQFSSYAAHRACSTLP